MLIKGMRKRSEFKISLRDFKDSPWTFRELLKIENVVYKWCVGVPIDCECVRFVMEELILGKILWLYNLKLVQVVRNFTCSDQKILFVVIWLVTTRVEAKEVNYWMLGLSVSLTCFRGWGLLQQHILFCGNYVGRLNWKHQKKKFLWLILQLHWSPSFCWTL